MKMGEIWMTNKKAIALVLGIMCFALTAGICIQVKTVKNTNSTSSKNLIQKKQIRKMPN